MSFFDEIDKYFNTRDLYEVLDISKENYSEKLLKKSYYKQSLIYHPDRCQDVSKKDEHTKKFQILAKIYSIFSNKDSKALYDETGEVATEDDITTENRDWDAYWRLLYQKLTKEAIIEFENAYRGSDKEIEEVKEAYVKCKGDMNNILDTVVCSRYEDEDRFREIIQKGIDDGEIPEFDAYTNGSEKQRRDRKKKALSEARESEELANELGLNKDKSLEEMILARRSNREKDMEGFLDNLAAKYSKPKTKKTKGVAKAKSSARGTKRKRK